MAKQTMLNKHLKIPKKKRNYFIIYTFVIYLILFMRWFGIISTYFFINSSKGTFHEINFVMVPFLEYPELHFTFQFLFTIAGVVCPYLVLDYQKRTLNLILIPLVIIFGLGLFDFIIHLRNWIVYFMIL
jgi:hypothetical protein